MLQFTPIQLRHAARLSRYYQHCEYRLCEYSVGVKLMWRQLYHYEFAEVCGCLVIRYRTEEGETLFELPVALPGEGDVDAALDAIDAWCMAQGILPVFAPVPVSERTELLDRYPYTAVENVRLWQDYLYRAEDLATFAGRRYSGQRNHINKFRKLYGESAHFVPLTAEDKPRVESFWAAYQESFHKETELAKKELRAAIQMTRQIGKRWVRAGGIEYEGRLIALSLAEVCADTLVCHIEKALPQYEGVYPVLVQSFAACFGAGLHLINREDDAADRGLRTSKLQYLPTAMGEKLRIGVRNELSALSTIPEFSSERLSYSAFTEADREALNRLCLDDARNRWWGYDYREDLRGELTEDYFLTVARQDFAAHLAVNFAVRLEGKLIGETVVYRFDARGGAELGCRILPEYAGNGYGAEAFRATAEWTLYTLGLRRLFAKCYRENEASRKMLAACMRPGGEDEQFYYFEKQV